MLERMSSSPTDVVILNEVKDPLLPSSLCLLLPFVLSFPLGDLLLSLLLPFLLSFPPQNPLFPTPAASFWVRFPCPSKCCHPERSEGPASVFALALLVVIPSTESAVSHTSRIVLGPFSVPKQQLSS
jgi:hypothetical protein